MHLIIESTGLTQELQEIQSEIAEPGTCLIFDNFERNKETDIPVLFVVELIFELNVNNCAKSAI